MVNKQYYNYGTSRSVIREIFEFGLKLRKEIGAENVYDFSLGNPSVASPDSVNSEVRKLISEKSSVALHGYTSAQGDYTVRKKISDYITRTYGAKASENLIYMTCGAAAALTITLGALYEDGDNCVVIQPYFPEYKVWANTAGYTVTEVSPDYTSFQINFEELKTAITAKTKCVIINSPNNPSGAVISKENIVKLAKLLEERQAEFKHPIFLIADEPYRELVYGAEVAYVPNFYKNTVVCYAFSKSLSIPGERIGYIAVSPDTNGAGEIYAAVCGAGRALGYVCAPSMWQFVAAENLGKTADISIYRTNRDLLLSTLTASGYECVKPDGTFYLFIKALEKDAIAFCERAKKYNLLLVPGDCFGAPGYVRIAYCVSTETVKGSLTAFTALSAEYRA
ncbi:MAG: pyridoxal phosphate-dependent aminotransferase [Christensenellaceae bacterium]|jgi:aspartate aminotransferase|nr:pyridoxal phosphate-dependent aminotransferase [Christensenellaceae bacterium]